MPALFATFVAFVVTGCATGQSKLPDGVYARLETSKGNITIELAYKQVPLAAINFAGLAEGKLGTTRGKGTKFYDGLTFHRVVKTPQPFVIQGGDPKGDGSGGPGYEWPDEINPDLNHDKAGVVSMANSGPDTNGSQFFITLAPEPHLDGSYTVFGHVVDGMDVVNKIEQGDVIKHVAILRIGKDAETFKDDQAAFDAALAKVKEDQAAAQAKATATAVATINQKWPKAVKTDNGAYYVIETAGTGATPEKGDVVTMDYKATLLDGTVFDSSENKQPLQFPVGQGVMQVEGWDQMAQQMKKGEKRLVILPPELAFGSHGIQGVVPPNSYIVLDLKLVSFAKP